jgi:hypothetical protein
MPDTRYKIVTIHLPGTAYVGRVNQIISRFEFLYETFWWNPIDRQQQIRRSVLALASSENAEWMIREDLSHYANDIPRLVVKSIRPSGSINIDLSGASDLVESGAEIIDPARRRARKEQLRHDMAMNRLDEAYKRLETGLKSVELVRAKVDMLNDLVKQGFLSPSQAQRAIESYIGMQDEIASEIDKEGAQVIDVVEDDQREIEG